SLFNTTNFYIRQIYPALQSEKCKPLHPLQQEVMDQLRTYLPIMEINQQHAYEKRLARELKRPMKERKKVQLNSFEMPTKEKSFVSYEFVDALFKAMNHPDYRALPAHTAQGTMKNVFQNWNSFFQSLADYRKHPQKYQARPRIPKDRKSVV